MIVMIQCGWRGLLHVLTACTEILVVAFLCSRSFAYVYMSPCIMYNGVVARRKEKIHRATKSITVMRESVNLLTDSPGFSAAYTICSWNRPRRQLVSPASPSLGTRREQVRIPEWDHKGTTTTTVRQVTSHSKHLIREGWERG
jgi:hypothetical protein